MKNKIKELLKNKNVQKALKDVAVSISALLALILSLTSCNVTRTITTESSSVQRGDTSVVIQTKTIESYNAFKNLPKWK